MNKEGRSEIALQSHWQRWRRKALLGG